MRRHLDRVATLGRNFEDDPEKVQNQAGWHTYGLESVLGREPGGTLVADGPFQRCGGRQVH